MPRIAPKSMTDLPLDVMTLLAPIEQVLGMVPNVMRTAAHSAPGISLLAHTFYALEKSTLTPQFRELATIAIAGTHGCTYCKAAHTAIGARCGLTRESMELAARGAAANPRDDAGIHFILSLIHRRGRIDQAEFNAVRSAGYSDAQIIDMVAMVAMHTFTNYLNAVAQTEIDFPIDSMAA